MATVQSEFGRIELFDDFCGPEWLVAETAATGQLGPFRVVGDVDDNTGGVTINETDPCLSGVARLTACDTADNDATGLATALMFDVAKMAPIVMETRVQFADLDTKEFYFGLTDVNGDNCSLEGSNIHGATTTLTLTASDLCGFFLSSELTDDEDWHGVYNGGTTTGLTTSTSVDLDDDAVAGEWQVLRLEVDPNGTARWYIDGVLKQTVSGAVSTTTDLAVLCMVEIKGTTADETADIDYLLVRANRDWTV